jgi:hypothetical protein
MRSGDAMQYFAGASRITFGSTDWTIGVNESETNAQQIGEGSEVAITPNGLAIWRLRVHGADVPGRWVVVDGRFVSAEKVWR